MKTNKEIEKNIERLKEEMKRLQYYNDDAYKWNEILPILEGLIESK